MALAVVAAVLPWPSGPAHAVHDVNLFELDGNAIDSPVVAGDDWNTVVTTGGASLARAFIDDGTDEATNPPADTTYFTTGGSKDINDIPDWRYNANGAPDKDEITNAYAAAYTSGGQVYVYFGLDRFDGSGDANAGFWFFQSPVSLNPDGTFSGVHTPGDILVVSEFTNGGAISTINVFAWDPTLPDAPERNLRLITTGADCSTSPAGDPVCALVNSGPTPAPWQYTPKSGAAGTFPTGSFLEGGVNLSALFPGQIVPCFSSFLAETRTSSERTASLADFALGSFEFCGLTVEKTGDTTSKVGDAVSYTITITNSGIVTLFKDDISDSLIGDITVNGVDQGITATNTCGASLAAGASCTITYQRTVLAGDPDPLLNTATVSYNSLANLTGTAVNSTDTHSVNLFQPQVQVVKTANPTAAVVGQTITYTISITNTGSDDSPNLVLDSISDSLLGDVTASAPAACATLAPAASCSFNVTRAVQPGDPDPVVNTVTVHYHPTGFPNDIADTDSASVNILQAGINITKAGEDLSKIGDGVTYSFTIQNTGAAILVLDATNGVVDTVLGNLTATAIAAGCGTLGPNATCNFSVSFTVPTGSPDPLVNSVTVLAHPQGAPATDLTDTSTHSINLFQPSVTLDKTGPALGQAGETVTYTFTVTNTGSADSPALVLDAVDGVVDTVLGDLAGAATAAGCDRILPGTVCVFTVDHTLAAAPDPLVNTATVHYHPEGFPNDIRATDSHTLNLFQPSVAVVKAGDTLSKVGDDVTYNFTITNTSSADSPPLILTSVLDDVIGSLTAAATDAGCTTLAPAASCNFSVTRPVAVGDPDPLVNTVEVIFHPEGFANSVTATDTHSVNLFQPSVDVTKTGDALSMVGDEVDYVITVTNTSSLDTPNLVNGSIVDSVLGDLLAPNPFVTGSTCTATLAPGASCTINATRTVLAGDPDPLPNTVTVTYNPAGFPNVITDEASHSVNLFQPSVLVEKEGAAQSKIGDTVTYTITVTNTSSAETPTLLLDSITDPLIGTLDIPAACDALDPGESCSFTADRVVLPGDPDPLVNTVIVHFHPEGFDRGDIADTSDSDSHSTDLFVPSVSVEKGGPSEASIGDTVTYTFTVTNTSPANSPALLLDSIVDPLIGTLTIPAACNVLDPGESCTFTAIRVVLAGDPDPLVNTVTVHYHPVGFPNDVADSDGHTIDIVSRYDQYPGDDDFDFDTPFDDAGDPGTPAPTTGTAGSNAPIGTQQPTAPALQSPIGDNLVEDGVTVAQPDPAGPVALDQLPRTGQSLDRMTMLGGVLLIIGGMAVTTAPRRREQEA